MSIDQDLWYKVKIIANELNKNTYTMPCDLIEEAIEDFIIPKYKNYLENEKEGIK